MGVPLWGGGGPSQLGCRGRGELFFGVLVQPGGNFFSSFFSFFLKYTVLDLDFFFFFLFMVAPAAYGSSQTRGGIRAAAAGLTTATATLDP